MQIDAKVVSNENIGGNLFRLKLDCGRAVKALPGQFINILVSEFYTPLLRRPFSIYEAEKKTLTIVYKVLGDATRILSEKKPGDELNFLGPLGNPYPIPERGDRNSELIIIGGGTGAASTYFLAKYLKQKKVKFKFIQGARSKSQMVASAEFKKLGCVFTTDDGSLGRKGFVTDVLEEWVEGGGRKAEGKPQHASRSTLRAPQDMKFTVFACGPKPMFKAIREVAEKKPNVKVFASFEEYMGCGIGACLSCVVELKKGDYTEYKRVCKDGTVFDLSDVVF